MVFAFISCFFLKINYILLKRVNALFYTCNINLLVNIQNILKEAEIYRQMEEKEKAEETNETEPPKTNKRIRKKKEDGTEQ